MSVPIVGLLLNYRDAKRSIECIQSLLRQPLDHVVVWDNSADEGYSIAKIASHFSGDYRVTTIVSTQNIGFAAGVNRGMLSCLERFPGAWILLINNDAQLVPGGAQKLRDLWQKNPEAKLVFPDIKNAGTVQGVIYYQYWSGLHFSSPHVGCFRCASGCCLLINSSKVVTPLLDEEFFMYGEDVELSWRLRGQRGALLHLHDVLVEHEGSASSGLGSTFYEERMVASHFILARKLAGDNLAIRYLLYLLRVLMLLLRAIFRMWRFRSIVPLVALWKGWRIAFISDPSMPAG